MRALTLFTATLAIVLGMSFSAQAATLTMSTDKSTYNTSETITLTVSGDSEGAVAIGVFGSIIYDSGLVSVTGTASQTKLRSGAIKWTLGGLNLNIPVTPSADSFSQINGATFAQGTTKKLTAIMTFHAGSTGIANFSWVTSGGDRFDFFGLTNAAGVSVTIVPEPTTAGLMGLGLLGLVVAGRRRKS